MGKRKAEPQKKSYEILSAGFQSAATIPALIYLTRTGEKYYFDAAAFFPEAEDLTLEEMVREDFGVGAGTDSMLYHFEETDLEVAALIAKAFESVLDSKTEVMGFECYVCKATALDWIKKNRPCAVKFL